jgi:hypothetical protein
MKSTIANAEPIPTGSPDLLTKARIHILDGSIGALSIDTCIFTDIGYRLESGILKRLEQFKDNTFRLVLSEITVREIHKHIVKQADEDRVKLVSSLRSIGKTWLVSPEKQASILTEAVGTEPTKTMVSKRLVDFSNRSGFVLINAKDVLDIAELLKRYFNVRPPFENSAAKKAEFPDAIALLSLQAWAKKNCTKVLFVTKDKGCQRYCLESDCLIAIDDLDDALALIQERDKHCAELCKKIEDKIWSGSFPELTDRIHATISEHIWDIDWRPEADAAFEYDSEMQDIEVLHVELPVSIEKGTFKVIDFRNGLLVVQTTASIEIEASCAFTFSVRDSIDRDMVNIGGAIVTRNDSVRVDVLLSFKNPDSQAPSVTEIELIASHQAIDFGSVEPDYGHEDPNEEGY